MMGAPARSVYDFVAAGGAPAAAIPVLVAHLRRPHHPRIAEGILRALATPVARAVAFGPLRDLFIAPPREGQRWDVANALSAMASFAEVRDLAGMGEFAPLFATSPRGPGDRTRAD
jgi:hypothetical protein